MYIEGILKRISVNVNFKIDHNCFRTYKYWLNTFKYYHNTFTILATIEQVNTLLVSNVVLYCHLIFQTVDWKGSENCILCFNWFLTPSCIFERKLIFLLSKKRKFFLLVGFFCRRWKTFQKPVETVKWALLSVFYKRNFPPTFYKGTDP